MSNKTEKETSQQQSSKAQPAKTIDPTPTKTTQNQPQNKKQTQTKTNIQQKPKEGKVQQSHKEVEKKEQKPKQQNKTKEQIIKQYIQTHKIQIANDQIAEFIKQESAKTTPFEPNNLNLWIQTHKKDKKPQEQPKQQPKQQSKQQPKPKTQILSEKQSKKEEKKPQEQTKQQQSKQQQPKTKTQIPSEKEVKNEEKKTQQQPKQEQPKPKTQISSEKQIKKEEKKPQEQPKQQQDKPKSQIPSEKQSKNEEKKSEDKIQLSNKQIINKFLQKETVEQIKQIQPDLIETFNKQMVSKLEINSQTINAFLKSGSNKNYESFKQWLTKHEQTLISQWHKKFEKSVIAKQIETHLTKFKAIVDLADQNKSNLNINIGAGENKGKTSLKMGMLLRQSQQSKFRISIQVKIKKKVQLKQFIQNQIKKLSKTDDQGLYKFSKIKFEQTQKSLTIHLISRVFQKYLFKGFIEFLQKKCSTEKPPILKAQLQVNVKNSIKQDENLLHNKRFIKWLAQGFTKSIKIQGNNKVAQHFSSPLAQYFPIFKVVRSGDVLLKLKKIENVDKLFDKLGINQICQQTPTLQKYLQVMVKQHLDSKIVLWVGDIIKYVILFACNIPNQRISIDTSISISHLLLYLNISAQACKELEEIVSKTNVEQFS